MLQPSLSTIPEDKGVLMKAFWHKYSECAALFPALPQAIRSLPDTIKHSRIKVVVNYTLLTIALDHYRYK